MSALVKYDYNLYDVDSKILTFAEGCELWSTEIQVRARQADLRCRLRKICEVARDDFFANLPRCGNTRTADVDLTRRFMRGLTLIKR
ncbi:MAG: hypothetical protein IJ774_09165 [Selenomonadaceae bacterium]|nr:hypothetical protein [Selenomonadaceae bacterium]